MLKLPLSMITLSLLSASGLASVGNQTELSVQEDEKETEVIRVLGSRDSGLELSSEKILKVPGAGNDPIKAIESLPGVILANSFAPAVRGSSPNDMYYQSDDVPIGYVFHNDRSSVFHPNLIQSFELNTGAWQSSYYDAVGGVIDTKLRDPLLSGTSAIVDFSLLRTGFLIESELTDTSAFYFAARQSLVHLYIENLLDEEDFKFTQAPINNDYQFKYINYLNDNNKLTVQATGANDEVGLLFSDDSTEVKQNPELKGGIEADSFYSNQSIIWTNESDLGETKYIFSRMQRNSDIFVGSIFELDALITDYLAKITNRQLLDYGALNVGAIYRTQNVDYEVSGKRSPCNNEFEVCPPSYFSPSESEKNKIDINFITAYADYDWDVSDTLTVRAGLVIDNNSYNDETLLEPRLTFKYQLTPDYRLKLAYGKHHQWLRQYKYLSDTFGSPDLKQIDAKHYVAAIEYESTADISWKIEAYYKDMDNLIVSNPEVQATELSDQNKSQSNQANYLNAAYGEAYGIELLINKAISNNWYGWLSIAYSKTDRFNNITQESFNYEYDTPWILNFVSNYEINDNWEIGVRWRAQSGQLYTPITSSEAIYDENNELIFYRPISGDFNSERLEFFHRMDLRLDYKTTWFGNETNIYFEVLNAYGKKSVSGFDYNEDYTEKEKQYQFPEFPLPSIGIQMQF